MNHDNPLEEWRLLRHRQQKIAGLLQGIETFRIETAGCDLTLGVKGRRICESSGAVNMPDGEV